MKLYEYQGRDFLVKHGVPAPSGVVCASLEDFEHACAKRTLSYPLVVKAQVLVGGRGKAGGIRFADNEGEAREAVRAVLGMTIKGLLVEKVLLVPKLEFRREFYASVLLDRSARTPLVMFSTEGGVDIESVDDAKIRRVRVNPVTGFAPYHARALVGGLGLEPAVEKQVADVLAKIYAAWARSDGELVEINPLAVTPEGKVLAGDAKVILDPDAEFRHPEYEAPDEEKTALEREAEEKGIAFVQLGGRIGIIANGAGLTMATLDAIKHYGGEPGIFLDLGGTDDPEKVRTCVLLMKKADPTVMLLNLFGGITKSDTVAKGLKMVLDTEKIPFPIVTRIKGVNEEEARAILKSAGLYTTDTLQEAAKLTVDVEAALVAKRPLPAVGAKVVL